MTTSEMIRLEQLHTQQKWTLEELNELGHLYKLFYEEWRSKAVKQVEIIRDEYHWENFGIVELFFMPG